MNKIQTIKFDITDRKAAFVLTMLVFAFVVLTLSQDFLRSGLKNSAFYFSESFMFSSFWWLFAPLLFKQYFVVNHKNKKQLEFQVAVIFLPIFLHLEGKKWLHNETLKSISIKLNSEQFVRVHKSTIVNIKMVASYTTRLNGDYDLTMKNNVKLRVSRNFATNFKYMFNKTHHLTTK